MNQRRQRGEAPQTPACHVCPPWSDPWPGSLLPCPAFHITARPLVFLSLKDFDCFPAVTFLMTRGRECRHTPQKFGPKDLGRKFYFKKVRI